MALDFHRLDNHEHLFGLDGKKLVNLNEIFTEYEYWTGVFIDEYGDTRLNVRNQKTLIKVIDKYIEKTDLNLDKQKTVDILEFRALMNYCSDKNVDIQISGD